MYSNNEESFDKIYSNTGNFWIFDRFLSVINQHWTSLYVHSEICLCVCINVYLVYITLAPISSNKEHSNMPPKLNQKLLTY